MEEKFDVWFILDLTVRIFAIFPVANAIANYYQNSILQTILILLFILWAFRPVYLFFKHLKKQKKIRKRTK